jgi:hypothetical protein
LDCHTDNKFLHCEDCVLYRTVYPQKDTQKDKEDTVVIFSSEDSEYGGDLEKNG